MLSFFKQSYQYLDVLNNYSNLPQEKVREPRDKHSHSGSVLRKQFSGSDDPPQAVPATKLAPPALTATRPRDTTVSPFFETCCSLCNVGYFNQGA